MKEVFNYYTDNIPNVYSYLVALKGQKPLQALVEIENAFTHLAQASQGKNTETNIRLARRHIVRLHLDLHKLLLVEVKTLFEKQKNAINPSFINATKTARTKEIECVGEKNPVCVIDAYKEAINIGLKGIGLEPLK